MALSHFSFHFTQHTARIRFPRVTDLDTPSTNLASQDVSCQACRLRRMRSAWVTFVKKNRQLISENDIDRNGSLKKVYLRLPRKVRPELQSGSTEQSFEFVNGVTHQVSTFFKVHHRLNAHRRQIECTASAWEGWNDLSAAGLSRVVPQLNKRVREADQWVPCIRSASTAALSANGLIAWQNPSLAKSM
jgi:hypothetical protein